MRTAQVFAFLSFTGLGALFTALAACTSATGNVSGGNPAFDATPPPEPDLASGACGTGNGPATWTALYKDFFGNPSPCPGCAGTGNCHGGTNTQPPNQGIWACGTNQESCYQGITHPIITNFAGGDAGTLPLVDPGAPENSYLLRIIRHRAPDGDGGSMIEGAMPQSPSSYVFPDAGVARITQWIQEGAKND